MTGFLRAASANEILPSRNAGHAEIHLMQYHIRASIADNTVHALRPSSFLASTLRCPNLLSSLETEGCEPTLPDMIRFASSPQPPKCDMDVFAPELP